MNLRALFLGFLLISGVLHAEVKPKELATTAIMLKSLYMWHYSAHELDDKSSEKIFDLYIKRLDPGKQYFLASDIETLAKYRQQIDNQLSEQDPRLFNQSVHILRSRLSEINKIYTEILRKPILDNTALTFETDPDKLEFVKNEFALKERWYQLIRYQVLSQYFDLYKDQFGTENSLLVIPKPEKINPKLELESREKVRRQFHRRISRKINKTDPEYFVDFLSAVSNSYDPHTNFLPPEEREDFDIAMSGHLEGIGAVLGEEDGYIKVKEIIPGGAAWKQKELKVDDIILKVGQNKQEATDIIEVPIRDAVKLIRGKKGSSVTLTVQKPDGNKKLISIVRDVIVIEETFTKSVLIKDKHANQYGYIYLPSFYRNFKDKSGRNASTDLRKEIMILKQKGIKGLILDLRNNGGGSLQDAVDITGHFIRKGPVVQIQNPAKRNNVLFDQNPEIAYDGPLLILINQYSASASEILAAALQDYGRAVIMGSKNSFGKGTVQTVYDLDSFLSNNYSHLAPIGSLKLTIQKFYRITGGSTQFKGVSADILVPSILDYVKSSEKDLDNALPWTQTTPASYRKWERRIDIPYLKTRSEARIKTDPVFLAIKQYTDHLEKQNNLPASLELSQFWDRQAKIASLKDKVDKLSKDQPFQILDFGDPENKEWLDNIKKDYMLGEATEVLNDLIKRH